MSKLAETRDERRYRRAKAHVAKGHEEEKKRLQRKGMRIGGGVGLATTLAGEILRDRRGKRRWGAHMLALPAGMAIGHLAGEREALKRLERSQQRGEHGHYAPFDKRASVISETQQAVRSQLRATKRSINTAKPVAHKPKVVEAPKPEPPKVAPSSQTPVMQTPQAMAKESAARRAGAESAIKKLRAKKSVGDMGERQDLWSGQKAERRRPGPENEPVPESWRGHDF